MLGWEFPPVFSGGLGVVTQELVQYLVDAEQPVTLLLPHFIAQQIQNEGAHMAKEKSVLRVLSNERIQYIRENVRLIPTTISSPYINETQYNKDYNQWVESSENQTIRRYIGGRKGDSGSSGGAPYGKNLFEEIARFGEEVLAHAEDEHFDVVHAHDWITAEAAIQLKLQRGVPMIFHVHATEVDRTGNFHPQDSEIFRREQYAMNIADKVITVSYYTKGILTNIYGIEPHKIEVVHNAYTKKKRPIEELEQHWKKNKAEFWVLFIGRVTLQKGPDYFVETAEKVCKLNKDVHFLIAGDGDMMPSIIDRIAEKRLQANVHPLGFISSAQRDALYRFADACIIPSVSEPFGLTAIEAVQHRTPLIVSRNCGANEVIPHKLEVDFWDSEQMAEYVLALKKYPALRRTLRNRAKEGVPDLSWNNQIKKIIKIYQQFL